MLVTKTAETVTNLLKFSPTHSAPTSVTNINVAANSIDSSNIVFHFLQLVAAFLFMIMVVGNKCFLKKRQTKEEEKCLQKTSYAVNITIVIFSLLAGMGFNS